MFQEGAALQVGLQNAKNRFHRKLRSHKISAWTENCPVPITGSILFLGPIDRCQPEPAARATDMAMAMAVAVAGANLSRGRDHRRKIHFFLLAQLKRTL